MQKRTAKTKKTGWLANGSSAHLPDSTSEDSCLAGAQKVSLTATFIVPAGWKLEKGSIQIQLAGGIEPESFNFPLADPGERPAQKRCSVCGLEHDAGFTQIKTDQDGVIMLGGILPDIVALIHRAHEKGFPALSTKDDVLLKACGGYRNPCKAFDDLKHSADYKRLFDTRRRGFISLRGAVGTNRNLTRNEKLPCSI